MFLQNNFNDNIFIPGELIDPVKEYEDHILNELCPNPDNMTYEQLLSLQDKVGNVSKGVDKSKIKKIPMIKFSVKDKNQIDKYHIF